MPKADKKPRAVAPKLDTKPKPLFAIEPWNTVHKPGESSKIEAYVEAAGDWQTVAEVRQTAHIDAEQTANFIVRAVNDFERHRQLIGELMAALELCLKCDGLTWEAEREAEIMVARAKQNNL